MPRRRRLTDGCYADMLYKGNADSDRVITDEVGAIADARGVTRAQVALAWLRRNPVVAAPPSAPVQLSRSTTPSPPSPSNITDEEARRLGARRPHAQHQSGHRPGDWPGSRGSGPQQPPDDNSSAVAAIGKEVSAPICTRAGAGVAQQPVPSARPAAGSSKSPAPPQPPVSGRVARHAHFPVIVVP
ncbi:hypothetical protein ACFUNF_32960 [Streptomyces sp. NPDC057291]|uniref:hypothetical protein n=1 Tax=Streptomyces sp. NPDC057291 TaxID=3346087 RepID=UPI003636641A